MVELNKKPLFVYTGSDVDRKEQAALFEALNPNIQEMDVPKSPTVPKDDVELMHERRNSESAASSPRHPSSPRRSVHAQCRTEIGNSAQICFRDCSHLAWKCRAGQL